MARNDGGRAVLLALGLLFAGSAQADETPPPAVNPQETPKPQETVKPQETPNLQEAASLQSFAASHPQCNEWSDGCAVCLREAGVKCSLPGIACQPAEIMCKAP